VIFEFPLLGGATARQSQPTFRNFEKCAIWNKFGVPYFGR